MLGIGNTLALSIIERTRELGVLRAVGMTRGQLRSTIRWESVVIALQGTVLGLVVGVFFGWALVEAMADEGLNTLDIPYTTPRGRRRPRRHRRDRRRRAALRAAPRSSTSCGRSRR